MAYYGQNGQAQQPPYLQQQQPQYGAPQPDTNENLAASMGNLGINDGSAAAAARGGKKTRRHAHHDIQQPTGALLSPPLAQPGQPQGQFFNPAAPAHPYENQPITAAMNQFPAQAGASFVQPVAPVMPAETKMDMGGSTTQARVDPEQIPSIPLSRDLPVKYYQENLYLTMEQHLPPPSTIPYAAYDQGNSAPKFARLTLNHIPHSADTLNATALPLGIIIQPLAPLQDGENQIPVLDFGEVGPPRCRRCRTYINPFMIFSGGGNKYICNMCTFANDVPAEYFAPTDPSGVRVDRNERPELRQGTVDFVVPKEYYTKPPSPLKWLFVIDVSAEAVSRGLLAAFCQGVLTALYSDEAAAGTNGETVPTRVLPEGCKVGFVTFDKDVHFYNCNAKLEKPQMLVMSDVEDPFVPLGSDGLFCDPIDSRKPITALLQQLPNLFATTQFPDPQILSALNSAMDAMSGFGGKIIASLSAIPQKGPGKLIQRDDGKLHGIDTEKKLFQTEHPGWKKTAAKMVEHGIGVDMFVAAAGGHYMDIATVGHVTAHSGGELYHYPNFFAPRDASKLAKELKHTLTRETGFQALMKVRCSNGLQVSSYYGNFVQHTFGADLELGSIDADKTISVAFGYDGKLNPKLDAHFQSALLYTTASGQRRVRCTNTVASVDEGGNEVMKFIDQDAVVAMLAKEAASRMVDRTLKEIRGALTERTIDILAGYRKAYSRSQPPGQLVLPENLKELTMYTLGLLKCRAFKAGAEPSDRRTHTMRMLKSASLTEISLLLYPRIYSLHNLEPEQCFPNSTTQQLVLPSAMRASFSKVEEGGAYLVDDGQTCLLWLHSQVSPNLIEDLFGPGFNSLQSLSADTSAIPVLETHLNAQVRNLMAYIGSVRGSKGLTIQLARQGLDGAEFEFARLLVEDRNNEAQSYVDWLVHIHRGVQMELSGQRKKEQPESDSSTVANLRAMGW